MLKAVKDWGALVAVMLAAVTGLLWLGEMRNRLTTMERNYGSLEKRVKDLEKPRPTMAKGDLCGKLFDGLVDASKDSISGESRQKPLLETAQKLDCFNGVPAASMETDGHNETEPQQ